MNQHLIFNENIKSYDLINIKKLIFRKSLMSFKNYFFVFPYFNFHFYSAEKLIDH